MTDEGSARIGCPIPRVTQSLQSTAHFNGGLVSAGRVYMDCLIDHSFEIPGHKGLVIIGLNDFPSFTN
jgi:hypothetical protein